MKMPITFYCICGSELSVPDTHAGKKGKCPHCNAIIDIPTESKIMPSSMADGDNGGNPVEDAPIAPRRSLGRGSRGGRGGTRSMRRGGGRGGRRGGTRSMKRGGGRGGTSRYSRGKGRSQGKDDYDDYEDDEPYFAPKKSNMPLIIGLCVVGGIVLLGGLFLVVGGDSTAVENATYELFDAVSSGKGQYAVNNLVNPDQLLEYGDRKAKVLASNPTWLTKGLTGSPTINRIYGVLDAGNQKAVEVTAGGRTATLTFIKLGGSWFIHLPSNIKNKLTQATGSGYFEVERGAYDGPPSSSSEDDWLSGSGGGGGGTPTGGSGGDNWLEDERERALQPR